MLPLENFSWSLPSDIDHLPNSFTEIEKSFLRPAGFQFSTIPYQEKESHEYSAMRFGISGKTIVFRQAKTTPNKMGQFVTLWKRPTPDSEIMPFEQRDNIDFCMIATHSGNKKGIFLFNTHILIKKGIFSTQAKTGKRAIRIYPSWVSPISKQAIQTQKWQSSYFINLDNQIAAFEQFHKLFSYRDY
ncbi:MepB family protein [Xenorhabdus bovienii]|uniref:MepB family protein n=1 Tax=Xenorhabdus bovienii TaxID=40576 RepID=UPI0023B2279D|nr:MepB family protein [Xenorhabdus bovienii]MDE9544318.1 MepB family protein [Xenorhabdus bovienii]